MPGDPATTHTAACHLWPDDGRAGSHSATSAASTTWARADGDVEADVGDLDLAGQVGPVAQQQAGLQGGEGDRAVGRATGDHGPRR